MPSPRKKQNVVESRHWISDRSFFIRGGAMGLQPIRQRGKVPGEGKPHQRNWYANISFMGVYIGDCLGTSEPRLATNRSNTTGSMYDIPKPTLVALKCLVSPNLLSKLYSKLARSSSGWARAYTRVPGLISPSQASSWWRS